MMNTGHQDVIEVGMSGDAAQPNLDPKHLTGNSEGVPVRSNEYLKLKLSGLGQSRIVQELTCQVWEFCPKIVFIFETR
jgi:hypothetical protein